MTTIVCPACKGAGKVRISWFKNKICIRCKGSGYVHILSTPIRQPAQSTSSQDDDAPALDFTHQDNLSSHTSAIQEDAVVGHGGSFGGAGASAHGGDSHSHPDCENTPPSLDGDSISYPDSSGGGTGGE